MICAIGGILMQVLMKHSSLIKKQLKLIAPVGVYLHAKSADYMSGWDTTDKQVVTMITHY